MTAGLFALVMLGAAAAHQRPYLGLIAPMAALAVGQAVAKRPVLLWVVLALTSVRGVRFAAEDVHRVVAIMDDLERERAIDVALSKAEPGDTVWLVSPALQTDDDKTAYSPVLWRFRPWTAMPIAKPVAFEYKDYRYGQPRTVNGITMHSSTELESAAFDHVASVAVDGERTLWIVLYDYSPANGMVGRIERVLQPYESTWASVGDDRGLGADQLVRVEGLR